MPSRLALRFFAQKLGSEFMSICSLDGQRALVTGAAGGLGVAISESLANSGADVAALVVNLFPHHGSQNLGFGYLSGSYL